MAVPSSVESVADRVVDTSRSERATAIALHDFVRDHIRFGFNDRFDASDPRYTLAIGTGHCIPKSRLMVSLLEAAGIEAHHHFVVLPKEILAGTIPRSRFWMIPDEISHCYVDVVVDGRCHAIDSYIVDTPLLVGSKQRLSVENRCVGYAVHRDSVNTWDGTGDAFSQFHDKMLIEDHGRIEDVDAFFEDARYRNRAFGISFNTMLSVMGPRGVAPINAGIDRIRAATPVP